MKKISVSQCLAEILCQNDDIPQKDILILTDTWNGLDIETREIIVDGLRSYLVDCVGGKNIEG